MSDTIAAIVTPPGIGGVGIVRVSGLASTDLCLRLAGLIPKPRVATYRDFLDREGRAIDTGLVIFFPGPHSFTGEDVVEFQGHGGPVVMDLLLQEALASGARMARPGEFSERAFLNGKIDLLQAESIIDLIHSASANAARLAQHTLRGDFSRYIVRLSAQLLEIRKWVEAAIDFPDEEIDYIPWQRLRQKIEAFQLDLEQVQSKARQGALLREGIQVAIIGATNAGKSSLLNRLTGEDTAIVTDVHGTTRDLVRSQIVLDALPVHLVDTAGIRDTLDLVEQQGIRRALEQLSGADLILWVYDVRKPLPDLFDQVHKHRERICLVANKCDLLEEVQGPELPKDANDLTRVSLSAKTGEGVPELIEVIKRSIGLRPQECGEFSARRRHLEALREVDQSMRLASGIIDQGDGQLDLVAEHLRLAHRSLGTITGEVTSDDLLGEIFENFCIGK